MEHSFKGKILKHLVAAPRDAHLLAENKSLEYTNSLRSADYYWEVFTDG